MKGAGIRRSDKLLSALDRHESVTVVTHDNPDPDAIAAGWAVAFLVAEKLRKPAKLLASGVIVRAENLCMVKLLKPPLTLSDQPPDDGSALVLVDCVPSGSNHILSGTALRATAVIDHHQATRGGFQASFRDIRPRCIATTSIAASYLREQEVEAPTELVTALLYAIRTEMRGDCSPLSRAERGIVAWLSEHADHAKIGRIESAPLSRDYFADLLLAIQSTFVYEDAALCFLPRASGPEITGEVADLIARCDGVRQVLCGAAIDGVVLVSTRASRDGGDALALLKATLNGIGTCGGHRHRAGGKVVLKENTAKAVEDVQRAIREAWLAACKVDQQRGTRLVAKKEILEGL
ncbi:MAG TPA: DHH family phosphoesterase [Planctomycetota bacterium]|nr:DHH family phosphoesterase [Planctomycetota bacterium]